MSKWYEEIDRERKNIVSSKVRLARNLKDYVFPSRLSEKDGREMVDRLCSGLSELDGHEGRSYETVNLETATDLERRAMKERRLINTAILNKKAPMAMLVSAKEDVNLVFNGADHIRIQVLTPGLHVSEAWKTASQVDDFINARFSYAFDEKYGYLTTYPTNVGTGMKASVIVHLPSLSLGKKFPSMISDMSRFGVTIKGVNGEGRENYGALYEISNQKTMGQPEWELAELVGRVAVQLDEQENQVRSMALKSHRLEREDEVYKSYGVLKYARRLSMKDAMTFLSQLMAGEADGLIQFGETCSVYRLMLGIQTASLQRASSKPLDRSELDAARAEYLRSRLPELR